MRFCARKRVPDFVLPAAITGTFRDEHDSPGLMRLGYVGRKTLSDGLEHLFRGQSVPCVVNHEVFCFAGY